MGLRLVVDHQGKLLKLSVIRGCRWYCAPPPVRGKPFSELSVSAVKEVFKGERRVALSPQAVQNLVKKGINVKVESGAGALAFFSDNDYNQAGAKVVDKSAAFDCDVILKVRPPLKEEIPNFKSGSTLISFVYPAQNKELVDLLAKQKTSLFAMDCVPRISRAKRFDAVSSMKKISGKKAVIEAANHFGRFFTGQITAAGKIPPPKVLVIGGGVAGLSAIDTAESLGAIVRCFDSRPETMEMIEAMGAEFLLTKMKESGEGHGGYAKEMSPEFIAAEMELFAKQCKEVDIIITTALIPGKKAPILITKDMIASMKPGSVVVDLAAEAGGNIETIRPGEVYTNSNGVVHIGYTDLPSRLPAQSSTLYANNITKFLLSMGDKERYFVNLEDEVIRGSIILDKGNLLWAPPKLDGQSKTLDFNDPYLVYDVALLIKKADEYLFLKDTAQSSEKLFAAVKLVLKDYLLKLERITAINVIVEEDPFTYYFFRKAAWLIKEKVAEELGNAIREGFDASYTCHLHGWSKNSMSVKELQEYHPKIIRFINIIQNEVPFNKEMALFLKKNLFTQNMKQEK